MKAKIRSFLNENRFILITGAISTLIMLIFYAFYSIIPFGDKTILHYDLAAQYEPLLVEFYDKITNGESLIYSWTTNLGGYYLGTYFNYLSSPLNLLILFFKRENIPAAIGMLVVLRNVLSSMSMAYYLKKSQKTDKLSIVAFGLMYAFCGYFFAYHTNIMWTDALYLLPLIALGIEKIIDGGKGTTYITFLAVAIYSNYYIGFMLCIFSCVYFLYYYVCSVHKFKEARGLVEEKQSFIEKIKNSFLLKSGIKFAISSLCVGLILSIVIIVLINTLSITAATNGDKDLEFKFYFNVYDFLANHLTSLTPTLVLSESDEAIPNIYCGILTVLLIPIYLLSKEIKISEKIGSIVFIIFMYFSFSNSFADMLWHAGSYPNGFTHRQSFMYSFVLVAMAFKVFKNIDKISKKLILISGIGVALFIVSVWIIGSPNVEKFTPLISLVFVLVYTLVLILINNKKVRTIILSSVIIASVSIEILTNIQPDYKTLDNSEAFQKYTDFKEIQSEMSSDEDWVFYRETLTTDAFTMAPCLYDFNGISVFNSMANTNICKTQSKLGIYSNSKYYATDYCPQTPVYNAMVAIKYLYNVGNNADGGDYYTVKYADDVFYALKNKYPLSIAYPVSEEVAEWDVEDYANSVDAQEEYFRLATGVEDVYTRLTNYEISYENVVGLENYEELKSDGKFVFERKDKSDVSSFNIKLTAEKDKNIYIYCETENLASAEVLSSKVERKINFDPGLIIDLGEYKEGESIDIKFNFAKDELSAEVNFIVFTVNKDAFVEGYKELKKGQLDYTEVDDTLIKGTFVAEENEILYTSIPYDKGWNVYLDGEKVADEDVIAISNAFIGIKSVSAGEHEIVFEYENIGIGACVSIPLAVILVRVVLSLLKKKGVIVFKKKTDELCNIKE